MLGVGTLLDCRGWRQWWPAAAFQHVVSVVAWLWTNPELSSCQPDTAESCTGACMRDDGVQILTGQTGACSLHMNQPLPSSNAWFPELRFCSSVQIGSNSIFPYSLAFTVRKRQRQRRYTKQQCGHGLRKRLRKWMNGNVMLESGITDVHVLSQCRSASSIVDVIQNILLLDLDV